jgi:hypothetical protein
LRWCQEQLLVQPVDVEEVEPLRPGGEESRKESLEKLLQEHHEALVVIRNGGLRHDRLPVGPNPKAGTDDQTQGVLEQDETPW